MKRKMRLLTLCLCALLLTACAHGPKKPDAAALFDTVCSADEALALCRESGAVVIEGMRCTAGSAYWDAFYKNVCAGKPGSVLCAFYYVLDREHVSKELYEQEKDRYPKLYFYLTEYDGTAFTVTIRKSTEDAPEECRTFAYLLHCGGEASARLPFDDCYVLVDDDTVSWGDIEKGMFSSAFGDWIPHCVLYRNSL